MDVEKQRIPARGVEARRKGEHPGERQSSLAPPGDRLHPAQREGCDLGMQVREPLGHRRARAQHEQLRRALRLGSDEGNRPVPGDIEVAHAYLAHVPATRRALERDLP